MTFHRYLSVAMLSVAFIINSNAHAENQSSIEDILALTVENNPTIAAASSAIASAEGTARQAALLPNPRALVEIENFAGDNELSDLDGAELTYGVEQLVETAGKRRHRKTSARLGLSAIEQQAVSDSLRVIADTQFAIMRNLIANEHVAVAEKRVALANESHEAVQKRVRAAAASDIEHAKIDIELKSADIELQRAMERKEIAYEQLRTLVGAVDVPEVDAVEISHLPQLPTKLALLNAIDQLPQNQRLAFAERRAKSEFNLAKAQAYPDLTVGVGLRQFRATDETALVATFSLPIPLFNRNQGGIARAKAEARIAESEKRRGYLAARQSALAVWNQFFTALQQVKSYRDDIIPSAEQAYKLANKGYRDGRYRFLDLLDAQRTLYEVQDRHLDSLLDLHLANAQADFLLSRHIELLRNYLTIEKENGK